MNVDNIILLANNYYQTCLITLAFIRKLPNGQYRVLSEKGKNLGTYDSKNEAKKRLHQIEYFKHKDDNSISDTDKKDVIDLTKIEDLSLSAIMRKLNKISKEKALKFLEIYKSQFDRAVKENLRQSEKIALQNTLIKFNKIHKIKLDKKIIKNAAITELGHPTLVGKYLADIIRFIMMRISAERRPQSLHNLKNKIYNLSDLEIANKNLPAPAAMGQSITLVKNVLFGHNAVYVREVINNIIKNL
jgi:hypothetical protein